MQRCTELLRIRESKTIMKNIKSMSSQYLFEINIIADNGYFIS